MNRLSKEEIKLLSPEQQEAYGDMELQRIKKRQKLLEEAKGYRFQWFEFIPAILLVVAMGFDLWNRREARHLIVWFFALTWLIQIRSLCLNRRFDALLELLEADSKNVGADCGDSSPQDSEKK